MAVDVVADRHDQLLEIAKDSAPNALLVRSRKKRSTMFSQEALVGVKCT